MNPATRVHCPELHLRRLPLGRCPDNSCQRYSISLVLYPESSIPLTRAKGKRRAFIQFEDVDHAAAFVNENFPKVRITLPHTTDDAPDGKISAYIHFAHRRDDTDARVSGGGQWFCHPVRLSLLHTLHALAGAITKMYAVRVQQLFFSHQVQAVRRVTILYVFEHML